MAIRSHAPAVRIVEVGPRDGLQAIKDPVPTEIKLDLIQRLEESGLRGIELTSAVSPTAVPQLADCQDVLGSPRVRNLLADRRLRLPVLVPNTKGLEIAVQHGVREVAVFVSATEGFSRANINCTVEQGVERAREVIDLASKSNVDVRGWVLVGIFTDVSETDDFSYVSCIFSDPYDGPTPPSRVLHCVTELLGAGCYEISLGDTLGLGSPSDVRSLITYLTNHGVPAERLAGHFHDTYGQAVANVWEAYCCGIRVFDSSVGGLGGCPFAPGAKGNVASEDVVYMFHSAGVETGVDLAKLVDVGDWISRHVDKPNASRVGTALAIKIWHKKVPNKEEATPTKNASNASIQWGHKFGSEDSPICESSGNTKLILNRSKNGNALMALMARNLTTGIEYDNIDLSILRIVITASGRLFGTGLSFRKQVVVARDDDTREVSVERPRNIATTPHVSKDSTIAPF